MNVIKDIRVYRSRSENIAGNSMPQGFANRELHIILHRIAMKLRENEFSMGDFNHLYVNLTTCAVEDKLAASKRERDKYHSWYCYYDAEVTQDLFDMLETHQCIEKVVEIVDQLLQKFFSAPQFDNEAIHACVSEAFTMGENMLMKFKEKRSAKNKAVVYLRYSDNGRYYPLLRVFDQEDAVILEKDLPETNDLDAYGEILLSGKKVAVKPRKNNLSQKTEPIVFML